MDFSVDFNRDVLSFKEYDLIHLQRYVFLYRRASDPILKVKASIRIIYIYVFILKELPHGLYILKNVA